MNLCSKIYTRITVVLLQSLCPKDNRHETQIQSDILWSSMAGYDIVFIGTLDCTKCWYQPRLWVRSRIRLKSFTFFPIYSHVSSYLNRIDLIFFQIHYLSNSGFLKGIIWSLLLHSWKRSSPPTKEPLISGI